MENQQLDKIGRFKVLSKLGKGSQGTVYLALDPYLERKVAIKTLNARSPAGGDRRTQLLQEARIVSKLQHPNIIPIFEVGAHKDLPYLVFEYIDGTSLKELIRAQDQFPIPGAVGLMTQIVDGLAYAHQRGIIHRDLSPANVLIGSNGVPRIMDFGISKMLNGSAETAADLRGTLRYMSPEHFANKPITPASDVFALGLIFYELLVGTAAVDGDNDFSVMYKIVNEPIVPPTSLNPKVDPELERIILKALEKDASSRYADAQEMKTALELYQSKQPAASIKGPGGTGTHSTVEFLLRRMRQKSDFPALSNYIVQVNDMTSSSSAASAKQLAQVILNDYSLTNKLLKLVNSAYYGQFTGGVTSISQAVVLLGFEQVRLAATSLILFTHLHGKSTSSRLGDPLIRSFTSAIIARDLAMMLGIQEREEAFICALFHDLGKNLAAYYFSDEYIEIEELVLKRGFDEQAASRLILGISYDELGVNVAKEWKFPERIVYSMRSLPEGKVEKPSSTLDLLRHFSALANQLSAAAATTAPKKKLQTLEEIACRFQPSLTTTPAELATLLEGAVDKLLNYSEFLGINTKKSSFIQRLIQWSREKLDNGSILAENADCCQIPADSGSTELEA
ncbi:MAG: HDOD domain-containing protein [Deltaproteobacteria bacterium]|nr:HDOD domain-containing protein [Deltaproteobacteria bacterium]MBW2070809.1 HDOD domain-containing protein [Deltaproteobacteria bacterium]